MATFGPYLSDNNKYIDFKYTVTVNSQDVANNKSNVTVKVTARRNNTGYTTIVSGATAKLKIDGKEYTKSLDTFKLTYNSNNTIFSKTVDISHDADGDKSLTAQFAITGSSNFQVSYSGNKQAKLDLPTIPRASSISSVDWGEAPDSGSTYFGECQVMINRKSSAFTHKVKYIMGDESYTESEIGESTYYRFPKSWMAQCPNATSMTCKVEVTTYKGSTKIGSTVSKSFKVTIPSWVKPGAGNVTVKRDGLDIIGKGKTIFQASGFSAGSGANIKSYQFYCSALNINSTQTTATYQYANNKAGSFTMTVKCIDTRGRQSNGVNIKVTIRPYSNPSIKTLSVRRCNSNGQAQEDGNYFQIYMEYAISSTASSKTITIKCTQGSDTISTNTSTALASKTWSSVYGSGKISTDLNYQVLVTLEDDLKGIAKMTRQISSLFIPFDVYQKGVGIGGRALEDGFLDVHCGVRLGKDLAFDLNGGDNAEHKIWFTNLAYTNPSSGTYPHRTWIGGGSSGSYSCFNIYDTIKSHYFMRCWDGVIPSVGISDQSLRASMYDANVENSLSQFQYTPVAKDGTKGRTISIFRENGTEEAGSTGRTVLRCDTNGKGEFGSYTYRWYDGFFNNVYNSSGALTTSDEKEKDNIKDLSAQDAIKIVKATEPKTYTLKEGNGRTHMGNVAQHVYRQLEKIIPNAAICCAQYVDGDYERAFQPGDEENNEDKLHWSIREGEFIAPILKTLQYILEYLGIDPDTIANADEQPDENQ